MGINAAERSARIHDLDMKHQGSVHQIDLVNRDEEARRLKLRALTLRDENAILKDRLLQREARLSNLTKCSDGVRAELEEAKENAKLQETRMKTQAKELSSLKTELKSLNESMQESSETLSKKFALTRELERLRPKIQHLEAQLANHQAIVAENLDLQRQVDSLEVALENEQRSKQRSQQRDNNAAVDEWKSKYEEAQQKFASEKKDWVKSTKENDRKLKDAEAETEMRDERIETVKSKLKSVQTELKETKAELKKSQAELASSLKASKMAGERSKKMVPTKGESSRKRRANDMTLDDFSIGTPGPAEAASKRLQKKRGVELGEKSTFSVTPFLNRTKNLSDESFGETSPSGKAAEAPEPIIEEREEEEYEQEEDVHQPTAVAEAAIEEVIDEPKKRAAPKTQKPRGRPKAKPLADAPTSKKNMPAPAVERTETVTLHFASKLDKVNEEPEASEQENAPAHRVHKAIELKPKTLETRAVASNSSILDAGSKKKRRILVGNSSTTIFDEEDGEIAKRPAKPQLGPKRRLKVLQGSNNAFATGSFSPLKRDKKGFSGSFLV
ncbi:hypothetical protein G7046_g9381 [Stylonectria norvegica]|nr:hypothetical protein G7046_g9381 [Stylonectria norvegica]